MEYPAGGRVTERMEGLMNSAAARLRQIAGDFRDEAEDDKPETPAETNPCNGCAETANAGTANS